MSKRKLTLNRFTELCKDGLAYLYCIKLCNEQETFYKVGVTSRENIFSRLSSIPYDCELIRAYSHPSSVFIFDLEKKLLKLGTKYQPLIEFGGSSECISEIDPVLDYLGGLNWISELLVITNKKQKTIKGNFASRIRQYFDCKKNLYQYQQGLLDLSEQEINILESSILECETDQDFSVVTEYINIFGSKDIRDLSDSSLQPKVLQEKITKHYELKLLKDMFHSKYKEGDMVLNSDLKQYLDYIKKKYDLSSALKLTDIGIAFEYKITGVKINGKKENSIKLLRTL